RRAAARRVLVAGQVVVDVQVAGQVPGRAPRSARCAVDDEEDGQVVGAHRVAVRLADQGEPFAVWGGNGVVDLAAQVDRLDDLAAPSRHGVELRARPQVGGVGGAVGAEVEGGAVGRPERVDLLAVAAGHLARLGEGGRGGGRHLDRPKVGEVEGVPVAGAVRAIGGEGDHPHVALVLALFLAGLFFLQVAGAGLAGEGQS